MFSFKLQLVSCMPQKLTEAGTNPMYVTTRNPDSSQDEVLEYSYDQRHLFVCKSMMSICGAENQFRLGKKVNQ